MPSALRSASRAQPRGPRRRRRAVVLRPRGAGSAPKTASSDAQDAGYSDFVARDRTEPRRGRSHANAPAPRAVRAAVPQALATTRPMPCSSSTSCRRIGALQLTARSRLRRSPRASPPSHEPQLSACIRRRIACAIHGTRLSHAWHTASVSQLRAVDAPPHFAGSIHRAVAASTTIPARTPASSSRTPRFDPAVGRPARPLPARMVQPPLAVQGP